MEKDKKLPDLGMLKSESESLNRGKQKGSRRPKYAERSSRGDPSPLSPSRGSSPDSILKRSSLTPSYPVGGGRAFLDMYNPHEVKLASGGTSVTSYGRDPFKTRQLEAVILEYPLTGLTFFSNNAATTDPAAVQAGTRLTSMFNLLLDDINYNGRFVPNAVGLTAAVDFNAYFTEYDIAFGILWTFLSMVQGLDLNPSTRSFGPGLAGAGNMDRALTAWDRLQKIPIAPLFVDWIKRFHGVIYDDILDFVILTYTNTTATPAVVTDWTSSAAVGTLLGIAEANLTLLEGNTTEASIIAQVLAVVYGDPRPLPTPAVIYDECSFDAHFAHGVQFLSAAVIYSCPLVTSTVGGSGVVPILVPKKACDVDTLKYYMSILRPCLYDFETALPGGANNFMTGAWLYKSGTQDFSRVYTNDANNNTIIGDTVITGVNYGNGTFYEIEWWASLVGSAGAAGLWQNDSRLYDRWFVHYLNVGQMTSNSNKLLDQMFLSELTTRRQP